MKYISIKIFFLVSVYITNLFADSHEMTDETYYQKGVAHYDTGEFKESYIVFFNLSEKGHKSSIHNLSNMYFEGIGTTQDYRLSLKYTWLCSLNGNKKCIKKIDKVLDKLSEESILKVKNEIENMLEKITLITPISMQHLNLLIGMKTFLQKLIWKNHIYGILYQ